MTNLLTGFDNVLTLIISDNPSVWQDMSWALAYSLHLIRLGIDKIFIFDKMDDFGFGEVLTFDKFIK